MLAAGAWLRYKFLSNELYRTLEFMPYPPWIDAARKELREWVAPRSGWSYKRGHPPFVEPTALAMLALQATDAASPSIPAAVDAARWLSSLQKANGAVGLSAALNSPEWPTPLAVLAWAGREGFGAELERATKWLLEEQGRTYDADIRQDAGHDPSIPGWPWVSGTHSWLEPTAWAVLALRRRGLQAHPRVRDGLRLIRDRALTTGGWNIGNSSVQGTILRPQPSLTGIALLAMSGTQARDEVVERACVHLQNALPKLRSSQALGWGLLGLAAWGIRPPEAAQWLSESYDMAIRLPDAALQVSYLLLAADERSLTLLGAQGPK